MKMDFGFHAKYRVFPATVDMLEQRKLVPYCFSASGPYKYSPQLATLIIEVEGSSPWALALAGDIENQQVEGVYACPQSTHFLAVVDSDAFYVNSTAPGNFQQLLTEPVRKVESYLAAELVLVIGFTTMAAIGRQGLMWTTARLVRDELTTVLVNHDFIFGHGDFRSDRPDGDFFKVKTIDGSILQGNDWTEVIDSASGSS